MGGPGSGRWGNHAKAITVEACEVLSMRTRRLKTAVQSLDPAGQPTLRVCLPGFFDQSIELVSWTPFWGGHAWYLKCPICKKHFANLYRPWGVVPVGDTPVFRCRTCWKLSYQSSQQAHCTTSRLGAFDTQSLNHRFQTLARIEGKMGDLVLNEKRQPIFDTSQSIDPQFDPVDAI